MNAGDVAKLSDLETQYVNTAGDVMTGSLDVRGKCPYPIGGTYVQFPGCADPTSLFVGTWTNISANFAGLFFRVEGGSAAAFNGGAQGQSIQSHDHSFSGTTGAMNSNASHTHTNNTNSSTATGSREENFVRAGSTSSGGVTIDATNTDHTHNFSGVTSSAGAAETRPTNITIRVWQRSA
jgi:hypothetical protein